MAATGRPTSRSAALRARRNAERAPEVVALPAEVEARIATYTPSNIPAADWSRVRPLVIDAVRRADPASPDRAQHLMLPAAKLALWAERHGVALTADQVFTRDMVDDWSRAELAAGAPKSSVATNRSHLRHLLPPEPASGGTIGRRTGAQPYTAAEDLAVARSALGQRTPVYRADACLLYGLGRGAGLNSQQIGRATTDDLVDHGGDDGVEIDVGGRAVWVLDEFCGIVRTGVALRERDGYLFAKRDGTRRDIGEYVDRFTIPAGTPRLNVARCRTTWIVDHLRRGTPLRVLQEGLGVKSLAHVEALLTHVEGPDPATVALHLRGAP